MGLLDVSLAGEIELGVGANGGGEAESNEVAQQHGPDKDQILGDGELAVLVGEEGQLHICREAQGRPAQATSTGIPVARRARERCKGLPAAVRD